jgi:hypothetical protein
MPLPLRKRTVHFYEIKVSSRTRAPIASPSCASLSDLLASFSRLATSRRLPVPIRKSPNAYTVLGDWNYDANTNCYELLISRANAAVSDVALRDLRTSRLRKAGKTKVEGLEVSAHVLVRPNRDGRTAALLLTMGAGVSAADIEILLRHLCREASKDSANSSLFFFDQPSGAKDREGKPLRYKVSYHFVTTGHQGQTLALALKAGEFQGMDLIAHESSRFDSGGNLEITEQILAVKARLPKAITAATIRNAVGAFLRHPTTKVQYDQLRVRYKTVAGKSTSATLRIQDLDAAFTLKEHIEFDSDVEAQQETLSPTILAGMRPLLQTLPT